MTRDAAPGAPWIQRWIPYPSPIPPLPKVDVDQAPFDAIFAVSFRIFFWDRFLDQFWTLFYSILGPKMVIKCSQNDFRHQPSTENRKTLNLITLSMKIAVFRFEICPQIIRFIVQIASKTVLQTTAKN